MIKQFLILFFCWFSLLIPVQAADIPQLKSQSWILVDRLTNTTLTDKNADLRLNPDDSVLLMVLYTSEKAIEEILNKGKIPIVVGGTGLYIDTIIYGIEYPKIEFDDKYRKELEERIK